MGIGLLVLKGFWIFIIILFGYSVLKILIKIIVLGEKVMCDMIKDLLSYFCKLVDVVVYVFWGMLWVEIIWNMDELFWIYCFNILFLKFGEVVFI